MTAKTKTGKGGQQAMIQTQWGPCCTVNLPLARALWKLAGHRAVETGKPRYMVVNEALAAHLKDGKKNA